MFHDSIEGRGSSPATRPAHASVYGDPSEGKRQRTYPGIVRKGSVFELSSAL